jgi:hypothetical protein
VIQTQERLLDCGHCLAKCKYRTCEGNGKDEKYTRYEEYTRTLNTGNKGNSEQKEEYRIPNIGH